jgi:subtilisin family serine protease
VRTVRPFAVTLTLAAILVPPVLAPPPPAVATEASPRSDASDGPDRSDAPDDAVRAAAEAALALPHEPDRLLVLWDEDTSARARARVRSRQDLESFRTVSRLDRRTDVVELPAGTDLAEAIATWSALPGVRFVEPDYRLRPATIPNDPDYSASDLWGMRGPASMPASPFGSRADEAWADGHTGSRDVHVVVIDQGVQTTHPDLAANVWTNPFEVAGDGIDNDENGFIDDVHGWDFYANDASVYDGSLRRPADSHGTHVAGTIGAVGDNGTGVIGVSP